MSNFPDSSLVPIYTVSWMETETVNTCESEVSCPRTIFSHNDSHSGRIVFYFFKLCHIWNLTVCSRVMTKLSLNDYVLLPFALMKIVKGLNWSVLNCYLSRKHVKCLFVWSQLYIYFVLFLFLQGTPRR